MDLKKQAICGFILLDRLSKHFRFSVNSLDYVCQAWIMLDLWIIYKDLLILVNNLVSIPADWCWHS